MKRRLLIDSEAITFVASLKRKERDSLYQRFELIREAPERHAEFAHRDVTGRHLDGYIEGDFAILFWDDFADRHVKIMAVVMADKVERR